VERACILPIDATPEDVALGLIWGSRFESVESEGAKHGVIGGTPTVKRGLTLNGTTDYIAYALQSHFNAATELSVTCVFNPDFAADDGNEHDVFDTVPSTHYRVSKTAGSTLKIRFGNVNIQDIPYVDFGAYWLVGRTNALTIASNGTTTDAWLNDAQILTADPTAWTPTTPTALEVGRRSTNLYFFDGKIYMLKFYENVFTQIIHDALCDSRGMFE